MKIGTYFRLSLFAIILAVLSVSAFSQEPGEQRDNRTFRTRLFVLLGDKESGKTNIPERARGAIAEIDEMYGLKNYRLISDHFQRLGFGGLAHSNSILKEFGGYSMEDQPVFTEWRLGPLTPLPDSQGSVEFRNFSFRARVPFTYGEAVRYESVDSTVSRFSVRLGRASVVATLQVPRTDAMLFFVVAVEAADPA